MTNKSKALRLADYIIQFANEVDHTHLTDDLRDAAAELRRLAAVEEELERIRALEPARWVFETDLSLECCAAFDSKRGDDYVPLYTLKGVK